MRNWISSLFIAFSVMGHAEAASNWVTLARTNNREIQVDTSRQTYSTDNELIVGVYRFKDDPTESTFGTNVRTCKAGGGVLMGILIPNTETRSFIWSASGLKLYDVVGISLCDYHKTQPKEKQKSQQKFLQA